MPLYRFLSTSLSGREWLLSSGWCACWYGREAREEAGLVVLGCRQRTLTTPSLGGLQLWEAADV
jgi:hypothetical protein